jgi:archaellum component FlaG (FlaF/FlaG flagellin family)
MKIFRSILTAALAVATLTASAQDISYTVDVQSPKRPQTLSVKVMSNGSMTLMDPPAEGNAPFKILIDNVKNAQYMLTQNGDSKVAVRVDAFNEKAALEQSGKPKVEETKEIKLIDGMNCRKVTAETDATSTVMWVTDEAGVSYQDLFRVVNTNRNAPGARNILPALNDLKGFPIEIVSTDKKTSEEVKVNIRNINREKLDAAMFSMDGYRVNDMRKIK